MADWKQVDSTWIEAIQYDDTTQTLGVRFLDGRVYQYKNVPSDIAQGMATAQSPGSYFWSNIRNQYDTAETE